MNKKLFGYIAFAALAWIIFRTAPASIDKAMVKVLFSAEEERGCFTLDNITYSMPSNEIPLEPLMAGQKENLQQIFSQPFHFIKAGKQSYAFMSDDGQTVLKFLKKHYLFPLPRAYLNSPPLSFCKTFLLSHFNAASIRFNEAARGYQMGYDKLKDETGILYLHFHPTDNIQQKVCLVDIYGRKFFADLDTSYFVLQKKADLLHVKVSELMLDGKEDEAKECLKSVLCMIAHRLQQGIVDHDHGIRKNYGFIEGRAVQIDIGDVSMDAGVESGFAFQRELEHVAKKLKLWVAREHPSLCSTIDEELHCILDKQ